MISFGDSYSDNTGWGNFLAEPPHWSHFSDGPNWVDYLESTYNESTIALRSTAFGGATINSTLITALGGAKTDIVTQVERFQELLTPAPASTAWTSADTLFTMWVGINDITVTYSHNNQSQLHATLMDSWYNLQATLYKSGARNFLYLNVPPFYRAPWFNPYPANRELLKAAIEDYNVHLLAKAKEFQRNYPEAFVLHFDAYTEFGGLLDKATEFGFRNVTDYCDEYAKGTANLTTLIPSCVNPNSTRRSLALPRLDPDSVSADVPPTRLSGNPPPMHFRSLVPSAAAAVLLATFATPATAAGSFALGNIDYVFAFGDSFSTWNWTVSPNNLTAPDSDKTWCNGPNWLDYLFRNSSALTRNFAIGGATTSNDIISSLIYKAVDSQIADFTAAFSPPPASVPWTGANSLFATWIGINDCSASFAYTDRSIRQAEAVKKWYQLQENLYASGARNFLFLNVPPMELSPFVVRYGRGDRGGDASLLKASVDNWNTLLQSYAYKFQQEHQDAMVMLYDTHHRFESVLEDGLSYGFKNTTLDCPAYSHLGKYPDWSVTKVASCVNPLANYFWLDGTHPTSAAHELLAENVLEVISAPNTTTTTTGYLAAGIAKRFPHLSSNQPKFARLVRSRREEMPFLMAYSQGYVPSPSHSRRSSVADIAADFLGPNGTEHIAKVQKLSDRIEDSIDAFSRPIRPWLPALGRFLIIVTFLEDALRILTQISDQNYYLQKHRGFPWGLSHIFLYGNVLVMTACSLLVMAKRYPEIATGGLFAVVIGQGLGYGLIFDLNFFLRNLSVMGGLLMVLSDSLSKRKSLFGVVPSMEVNDADRKKYFQLAGRVLLIFLFLGFVFNGQFTFARAFVSIVGLVACVNVAIGFKAKLSAMFLVVTLSFFNLFINNFWAVHAAHPQRDFLKYDFFQTLSIVGGLLLLVNLGPGEISVDKGKKHL
ncbi:COPII-coated vesicle protein SurF4/Erv29 [Pseudohyphozyma bogoriensis]|nr:COPII-coated vesicle protein SurF4/Erv29 [Pseudohyphozyma bogoriensis]